MNDNKYSIVDLFSGAGGMSYGFHKHPGFQIIAAVDAEFGKPSSGKGKLQCNITYKQNIGLTPSKIDLSSITPKQLLNQLELPLNNSIDVLTVCPPCTGFSRANPQNHLRDDARNNLVRKSAIFATELGVKIIIMENARELIRGNFKHHYEWFRDYLENNGYNVFGRTYFLSRFGLPQIRERSIIIASKQNLPLYTLESLWNGWDINKAALTVRRAFCSIDLQASGVNLYPSFSDQLVKKRLSAIPKNGGSWMDLLSRADSDSLLTNSMKRIVRLGKIGSYPDVYGRMAWDKPAPTIKRECAHAGNGRYSHPEENRLCSVREIAILQGFPNDFVFGGVSISNMYRHIGDAVPPLISYQLAHLCYWMLTKKKPSIGETLLEGTNINCNDLVMNNQESLFND